MQTDFFPRECNMLDQLILGLHLLSHHNKPAIESSRVESCWHVHEKFWARDGEDVWGTHCAKWVKPNNNNAGLYARDSRSGFGGGFYYNSERRWSWHGDWTYEPHPNIGLTFGLVTGYKRAGLLPVFVPSVKARIPGTKLDARVSYLRGLDSDVFHLSIETLTWR